MYCRDAMTPNPVTCRPEDSAAHVAQLMKEENVGSIPVVDGRRRGKLVGIVTDRDLALEVVAEGREAKRVKVGNVMTTGVVTVKGDDDYDEALEAMADNQIRRVPVVDRDGYLIGIIAQADVARHGDDDEAGDLVERISKPTTTGAIRSLFEKARGSAKRSTEYAGRQASRAASEARHKYDDARRNVSSRMDDIDTDHVADAARELGEEGMRQAQRAGAWMKDNALLASGIVLGIGAGLALLMNRRGDEYSYDDYDYDRGGFEGGYGAGAYGGSTSGSERWSGGAGSQPANETTTQTPNTGGQTYTGSSYTPSSTNNP